MTSYAAGGGRPEVVIAAGVRSPLVRAGGAYAKEDVGHLGAWCVRELLARSDVDPEVLDEVVVGCVGPPHDQANPARVIAVRADVPWSVPARTVARNCASGFEAVTAAATDIIAGISSVDLCLGVEVMSRYPLHYGPEMTALFTRLFQAKSVGARLSALASFRPSFLKPRVSLMEGLRDPTCGLLMGQTAEVLARDFGISRQDADEFATESHQRARRAREAGRFAREIAPFVPLSAKASLEHDDGIRDGQTVEQLAKLHPYFEKPDGIVTVGNSCGITDGAAALLVASRERADELGLEPLARIRAWAWAGLDPARMGLGPVFATQKVLAATGLSLGDFGVIEINEAFAAQVLACARACESEAFCREHFGTAALGELDLARTNVNGGAIALGHPVGATGARLLLTTAHEMAVRDVELGLATLCIGGGQGGAVVLERITGGAS